MANSTIPNSLLPQQILPPNTPWGVVNKDGQVIIAKSWWLFLYNIFNLVLVSNAGTNALITTNVDLAEAETSGDTALALLSALKVLAATESDLPGPSMQDVSGANLLAWLADVDSI